MSEVDGQEYLYWRYIPRKRDGKDKNIERKNLFDNEYSSITADIKIPKESKEVEEFLSELLKIVDIRIKVEDAVINKGN